jgi:hypothetical protein
MLYKDKQNITSQAKKYHFTIRKITHKTLKHNILLSSKVVIFVLALRPQDIILDKLLFIHFQQTPSQQQTKPQLCLGILCHLYDSHFCDVSDIL